MNWSGRAARSIKLALRATSFASVSAGRRQLSEPVKFQRQKLLGLRVAGFDLRLNAGNVEDY